MNLEIISTGFLQVKAFRKGLITSFHLSGLVADFLLFIWKSRILPWGGWTLAVSFCRAMKKWKSPWTAQRCLIIVSALSFRLSLWGAHPSSTTSCICCPPGPLAYRWESKTVFKTLLPHPLHRLHHHHLRLQPVRTQGHLSITGSGSESAIPQQSAASTWGCCAFAADALVQDFLLLSSHTRKMHPPRLLGPLALPSPLCRQSLINPQSRHP